MPYFSYFLLVFAESLRRLPWILNRKAGLATHIVGMLDCLEGLPTDAEVKLILGVDLWKRLPRVLPQWLVRFYIGLIGFLIISNGGEAFDHAEQFGIFLLDFPREEFDLRNNGLHLNYSKIIALRRDGKHKRIIKWVCMVEEESLELIQTELNWLLNIALLSQHAPVPHQLLQLASAELEEELLLDHPW